MDFNTFLANLNNMGFYDFVLPWILFLVIFFVIINETPFIKQKEKGKQIAVVIAAILAFFAINFIPLGELLSTMFATTGIYLAAVLVVILFVGMAGYDLSALTGNKMALALLLALIAILVLGASGFPMLQLSDSAWTLIFVLILIGGAVLFLGGEDKAEGKAEEAGKGK